MQKFVYLALGSGLFCALLGCGPTAPTPSKPSPAGSASPSASPSVTPSGTPTPTPSSGTTPTVTPTASATPLAPNGASPVASLSLETDRRLFDAFGQTAQLKVTALDGARNILNPNTLSLTFSSSRPSDFSVTETGLIKAIKDNGFSVIRVTDTSSGKFAELTLSVSSSYSSSGGGGGGGGGNVTPAPTPNPTATPSHNVTGNTDYSDVEFEPESVS